MKSYRLRPIKTSDFAAISHLSDAAFGANYINSDELRRQWPMMQKHDLSASFLLENKSSGEALGFRITFLPGTWFNEKEGKKCLVEKWPLPTKNVAYFKTALVSEALRGQGWGRKMANASIEAVKKAGGQAVVTHSWNESPGDSSGKYLKALGFHQVGVIQGFWGEEAYQCVECNNTPCTCTATEMILEI